MIPVVNPVPNNPVQQPPISFLPPPTKKSLASEISKNPLNTPKINKLLRESNEFIRKYTNLGTADIQFLRKWEDLRENVDVPMNDPIKPLLDKMLLLVLQSEDHFIKFFDRRELQLLKKFSETRNLPNTPILPRNPAKLPFPDEILENIFVYLNPQGAQAVRATSTDFRRIIESQKVLTSIIGAGTEIELKENESIDKLLKLINLIALSNQIAARFIENSRNVNDREALDGSRFDFEPIEDILPNIFKRLKAAALAAVSGTCHNFKKGALPEIIKRAHSIAKTHKIPFEEIIKEAHSIAKTHKIPFDEKDSFEIVINLIKLHNRFSLHSLYNTDYSSKLEIFTVSALYNILHREIYSLFGNYNEFFMAKRESFFDELLTSFGHPSGPVNLASADLNSVYYRSSFIWPEHILKRIVPVVLEKFPPQTCIVFEGGRNCHLWYKKQDGAIEYKEQTEETVEPGFRIVKVERQL